MTFLNKYFLDPISEIGQIIILSKHVFQSVLFTPHLTRRVLDQVYYLGVKSISTTILTAIFIGMVFTLQIVTEFERFGANYMLGGIVGLAIWRELGPLLTAVIAAGRVGAAISSEIGTMKVTEQVDALQVLSQDPVRYLVAPRVIAALIVMPFLVFIADVIGFFSGLMIGVYVGQINPNAYFNSAQALLGPFDIIGGLIKSVFFGYLLAIISCNSGLNSAAGAKGVGQSTTLAVVKSLVSIFIFNYFLSFIIFQ